MVFVFTFDVNANIFFEANIVCVQLRANSPQICVKRRDFQGKTDEFENFEILRDLCLS